MSNNGTDKIFLDPMIPFEVIQIPPGRLHDYWSFVSHGLSYVMAQFKPDWTKEDVYAAIYSGRAELFVFKKGDRLVAFYAGYVNKCPWNERQDYVAWVTWSIELADRIAQDEPVLSRALCIDFVKERAKTLKCANLVLFSNRKGWERFGFVPHVTEYRMPL